MGEDLPFYINGFLIEEKLEETKESIIYKVHDKVTCRKLVGKLCLTESKNRINQQIEILSTVNNPHILRHEDVLEVNNHTFIIMPYVEGPDLEYAINKYKYKFTEKEVANILYQSLSAIDYLHQLNICHADIKLENIMLKSHDYHNPYIYLIDFGHSHKFQYPGHIFKGPVGTPNYNPPELIRMNKCM